jgi:hypothetical protein
VNGEEAKRRRVLITQAVAALTCFVAVHGAHAGTLPGTSLQAAPHAHAAACCR